MHQSVMSPVAAMDMFLVAFCHLLRFSGSARMEPSGSTPTTMQSGHFSLSLRPIPEMVPPVPAPSTIMSTWGGRGKDWIVGTGWEDELGAGRTNLSTALCQNLLSCNVVVSQGVARVPGQVLYCTVPGVWYCIVLYCTWCTVLYYTWCTVQSFTSYTVMYYIMHGTVICLIHRNVV